MSLRARAALLALLVFLVTAGPAAGIALPAAAQVAGSGASTGDGPAQTAQPLDEPTETTFVVRLEPDGDAHWTVRMNFSAASEQRATAFGSFADEFENGDDLRTVVAARQASGEAASLTGREMVVTDVQRDARLYNGTGQLVVRFTWTNFARQANGTLHVDDAFNTTDVTWFSGLGANQALVVRPPPEHALDSAEPAGYQVSDGSVRWDGPRSFAASDVAVTYRDVGGTTDQLSSLQWMLAGLAFLGALGAAAYALRGRDVPLPTSPTGGADTAADGQSSGVGVPDDGPQTAGEPGNGQTATGDPVDEELLSDEERIERLLEENGGRMKQANIVTETGWSNAKVSQLLSAMDESDRIDKLRIGRENLISFPEENVADIDDDEQ